MAIPNPKKLGNDICEALGLDASQVVSIGFQWSAGETGMITVEMMVNEKQAEDMNTMFQEYHLVEKKNRTSQY